MSWWKTHIVLLLLFMSIYSSAQTKVEVITKTVRKNIAVASGTHVSIQGQGARIQVVGSESNQIELTLKFISKGLTKGVAEKELNYQKYVVDELNDVIVIRNYLLLPQNVELTTIQETVIEVRVPNDSDLTISNAFGSISLTSFNGKMEVSSEYGDVVIQDVEGSLKVKENFGDLTIKGMQGGFTGELDHTELELIELSGSAVIKSNLGTVQLVDPGNLSGFRANCQKTDIYVSMSETHAYQWEIKSKYGTILMPQKLKNADTDPKEKRVIVENDQLPRFQLTTDFGNVMIEEK